MAVHMRVLILGLAVFVCSCSAMIKAPLGVVLSCETEHDDCPPQSEPVRDVEAFAEVVPFDALATLTVRWFDADHVWRFPLADGSTFDAIAYTEDTDTVDVTSRGTLVHELMHVHYWRDTGDGDANHEAPPGPWTATDNDTIRLIENNRAVDDLDAAEENAQ